MVEFDYVCLRGYCLGVDKDGNMFVFLEKDVKKALQEHFEPVFGDFKVGEVPVVNVEVPGVEDVSEVINVLKPLFARRVK